VLLGKDLDRRARAGRLIGHVERNQNEDCVSYRLLTRERKKMKRKTAVNPTLVYSFGCKLPTSGEEELYGQLRLANQCYNHLVEIETKWLRARMETYKRYGDYQRLYEELATAYANLDSKTKELRLDRAGKTRDEGREVTAAQAEVVKELKTNIETAKVALGNERKRIEREHPQLGQEMAAHALAKKESSRNRSIHQHFPGLYWGTLAVVRDAVERASKDRFPLSPKFKRFTGEGTVAVQFQAEGGSRHPIEELFGSGNLVRIKQVPEGTYSLPRSARRRASRTMASIRIGSNEKREPIWVELPVILHRQLPTDGNIKWVRLCCRKVGNWRTFDLQVVLETGQAFLPPTDGGKSIGIDLGWRDLGDAGIKVAHWTDSDGEVGSLLVPRSLVDGISYADEIRSVNDTVRDTVQKALVEFRKSHPSLPEWFTEHTLFLHLWEDPRKFAYLLEMWRDNRFAGDSMAFEVLETWRRKNWHLRSWETRQRRRLSLKRRELFRVWSHEVAAKYDRIYIEDFDLRPFSKAADPTKGLPSDGKGQRRNRTKAAPGELRGTLKAAVDKSQGKLREVDKRGTSQECPCGAKGKWDEPNALMRKCLSCGNVRDRDEVASGNILARGEALRAVE
jgi:transposase